MTEIKWNSEKQEELTRLENARDKARNAGRYSGGDYERIRELKDLRLKSEIGEEEFNKRYR